MPQAGDVMTQRNRKLFGTILMVLLIVVYSALATALYLALFTGAPPWVLILYFAIAGLGWGIPAAGIIRFMARPD